jgi:serine/threonine protein kinase
MTTVLDPDQPLSCSAQLEGGTITFISPELFFPSKFGMKDTVPTPEADIYAFGLVIFQVCEQGHSCRLFPYSVQVLASEIPFRGLNQMELGYSVVGGKRPEKPVNASALGFSDSLWDFAQRCWDGDMKLRPKVWEVATCLENTAANWSGLMAPGVQAEYVVEDPMSDSMQHCELKVLILR